MTGAGAREEASSRIQRKEEGSWIGTKQRPQGEGAVGDDAGNVVQGQMRQDPGAGGIFQSGELGATEGKVSVPGRVALRLPRRQDPVRERESRSGKGDTASLASRVCRLGGPMPAARSSRAGAGR